MSLRCLFVILAVSLPLAFSACGGSEGASPTSGAGHDAGSGQPSGDPLTALSAFAACMRARGIDVPNPTPDDPFAILHSLDQRDPAVARVLPACQDKLAVLNAGG